ncbi:J domain-containing protein 1 [Wickerhamomyces ciferrii]|uniref:J domain-containing protein 1 n=1 Tax=Wickerhamomyces ciferrii (strain ATCC 14091 / BCRC 22168 / CBS 111 / JCM 3599 / NBRC 0793 / NRRL Y-1031 F-60-10) TaxID=1206466 RepID=K0KPM2_WICCF|nr:J domain-containing protein 1 [Wickerhamomyces ciferrii]CCH44112.1 J domain-containing protein 1 [Wickerhamomyces ciferrii]
MSIRNATTIHSSSPEDPYCHSEWPSHNNPTPYDVFNLKPSEFDTKILRKKYFEIAKIYHPDISLNKNLINHKGDKLTNDHKNERFKILTNAYSILKDDKKRELYDRFKMGWNTPEPPTLRRTTQYQRPSAYANQYHNQAYWNASGWEDYENLRNMNDPALRPEKMKILAAIITFIIVTTTIQGWMILNNAEKAMIQVQKIHDDTEFELDKAYMNYGLDQSRISRLRRFLWFRTFGLYKEKDQLDSSHKENEAILKKIAGDDYDEHYAV